MLHFNCEGLQEGRLNYLLLSESNLSELGYVGESKALCLA